MAGSTVYVRGWREMTIAMTKLRLEVGKEIRDGLKQIAEPIAADARGRIGRYRGASTSTIKPYPSTKGVVVRQSQGKRGGGHAQFGSLQMGHLMGAAADGESQVRRDVEDLLDHLTREEGL